MPCKGFNPLFVCHAGPQIVEIFCHSHLQVVWESFQALFFVLVRNRLVYVYEVEQWYIDALRRARDEVRCCNVVCLKGQSHGDFPIFFVTILINLYQSTLFTYELLLDHQGDNIK